MIIPLIPVLSIMRKSAGILLYRNIRKKLEVFLVHPGGPFWKAKDKGAWSIPKGEFGDEEDALASAIREFKEETGVEINGDYLQLSPVKLKSGKIIFAWAVEGNLDEHSIISNYFSMEWPPKSGKQISVPEVDKGAWFTGDEAREKINPAQINFIDQLEQILQRNT
jgi:predicted NUDIX family NTP pyrophosphohydrolase